MRKFKTVLATILVVTLIVCTASLSAYAADEEKVIFETSFSDGDVAANNLNELGGHATYYFSFDWELLYDTTVGGEIYFVVDSADASAHHYMHRFAIDEQTAGTKGHEAVTWDFYGKPNMGYGGEHGAIVVTEVKYVRFLVKNIGGFSLDNFEIRKDNAEGEVVFSTDFSNEELPSALQVDTDSYDFAGIRNGKFVAEFKDGVVGNPNYHLSALKINSEVLPLIWHGSGYKTAEVANGNYTVDNDGNVVCADGYFPFFETNPNKVDLKWGVGDVYHISFDYKYNYAPDGGDMYFRLETADGKVTAKQINVPNPNEINTWEHFSVTIDANGSNGDFGDIIAADTQMMIRLINKKLKGISIDNLSIATPTHASKAIIDNGGGSIGTWINGEKTSATLKFTTAGSFNSIGLSVYWASNPVVGNGPKAEWKCELFKFEYNIDNSVSKDPVKSNNIISDGDDNPHFTFDLGDDMPSGTYVVRFTLTNPEYTEMLQQEGVDSEPKAKAPYLVLPKIDNPDSAKFEYDCDPFNLILNAEIIDGDFFLVNPDETAVPTEPETQPGTEPETNVQTGDATVAMFAVIVVLAMGIAVVFAKRKSF